MFVAGWIFYQGFVRIAAGCYGHQRCILCMDEMYCIIDCTNVTCCIYYSFGNLYCCKFLMYPVLNLTLMLNFLDTSSMSVTSTLEFGCELSIVTPKIVLHTNQT
jgi:hypothetical protein